MSYKSYSWSTSWSISTSDRSCWILPYCCRYIFDDPCDRIRYDIREWAIRITRHDIVLVCVISCVGIDIVSIPYICHREIIDDYGIRWSKLSTCTCSGKSCQRNIRIYWVIIPCSGEFFWSRGKHWIRYSDRERSIRDKCHDIIFCRIKSCVHIAISPSPDIRSGLIIYHYCVRWIEFLHDSSDRSTCKRCPWCCRCIEKKYGEEVVKLCHFIMLL